MKINTVIIRNYRSIEEISFEFNSTFDGTTTFGLIGVNEAGKSSILKALALKELKLDGEGLVTVTQKEFKDKTKPIEVIFFYSPSTQEIDQFKEKLRESEAAIEANKLDFSEIILKVSLSHENPAIRNIFVECPKLGDNKSIIEEKLKEIILSVSHKVIFWAPQDRYIISEPIDLLAFADRPDETSVPLENCFGLAGIVDVKERISRLTGDSTELEQLEYELSKNVTLHIKKIWPKHPIEITFKINSNMIHLHVKDLGTNEKAKTSDQRSDGFRQFISFLLTVSAQDKNDVLANTLLVLDEPETHLHPEAQQYLLQELIRLTQNQRGNIVFFATHSIFMIDKVDLSRNYKIFKKTNQSYKEQLDKKTSTYSSIIYEVFGISSTDYHNELYSRLHQQYQDAVPKDSERERIKNFDENFYIIEKKLPANKPWRGESNLVSLPTYIRTCIAHMEESKTYTSDELIKSIEIMRSYLNVKKL